MKLLSHQISALNHAIRADERGHGTLLYHTMGSGKTITVLSICMKLFSENDIFVFSPSSVKSTWRAEKKLVDKGNILRVNVSDHAKLSKVNKLDASETRSNSVVIVDEAHHLLNMIPTNPNILVYLRTFHRAYLLTGTPIVNDMDDISTYVNILAKRNVIPSSIEGFREKFTIPISTKQKLWNGYVVKGAKSFLKLVMGINMPLYFFSNLFMLLGPTGTSKISSMLSYLTRSSQAVSSYSLVVHSVSFLLHLFSDVLLVKHSYDYSKMAEIVGPYISLVLKEEFPRLKNSNTNLGFPRTKHVNKIFSYTSGQFSLMMKMLKRPGGYVSEEQVDILFGSNINRAYRDGLMRNITHRISGKNKMGGADIGRLSAINVNGKSPPSKFEYVADMCSTKTRVVIYSQFRNSVINLMEFLTEKRPEIKKRIQNLLETYPNVNIERVNKKFLGSKDIVVLHPEMREGISIKGASILIVLEPFTDASSKQQLEARVSRLGSHAGMHDKTVTIVTCVTGMTTFDTVRQSGNTIKEDVIMSLQKWWSRTLTMFKKNWNLLKLSETPPWVELEEIEHISVGPEVLQERRMIDLERHSNAFAMNVRELLAGKNFNKGNINNTNNIN
jgi:hypothetical protein